LYQESEPWRPKLDGMPFNSLDEESATFLERYFDEDEILQAQDSRVWMEIKLQVQTVSSLLFFEYVGMW
jgi:hypothetical protein